MYTAGLDAGGYMIDSLLKNLSARHQRSHKGRTVQGMAHLVVLSLWLPPLEIVDLANFLFN